VSVLRVHRRKRDFTITVNTTPRDRRLSARARGVLWFLLTQQDGYPVNAAKMAAEEFPEGRDALERAIRELLACGYLTRRREQNERGHWITFTDVYETPELAATRPTGNGIPGVGNLGTDNGFSGVGETPRSEHITAGRTDNGLPEVGQPVAIEEGLIEKDNTQEQTLYVSGGAADSEPDTIPVVDAEIIEPSPPAEHPDAQKLCDLLADEIQANTGRRPTVGKRWLDAARLLLDRDGLTSEQVEYLIRWSQADEFWRSNILSMPKLREKRDTLILRIKAERNGNGRLTEHERRRLASVQELLTAGGTA